MSTRAVSNLSSKIPKPTFEAKRMTRSTTRKVLGDITTSSNVFNKNPKVTVGKALPKNGKQIKVSALRPEPSIFKDPSVLSVPEERVLPPGVKDIDAEDGDNPQLCSEYAMETFVYLRQLEKRYAVRSNHLLTGSPTNAKMRATLIDWLVEVKDEFKLTQESLYLTVHTIDRYLDPICVTIHIKHLIFLTDSWLGRVTRLPATSYSWSESPRCFWLPRVRKSTRLPSPTLCSSLTALTITTTSGRWSAALSELLTLTSVNQSP